MSRPRRPSGPWVVDLNGQWFVAAALVGPFPTNAIAWRWIDQHESEFHKNHALDRISKLGDAATPNDVSL
jgi:hypothetical protein